MSSSIKNPYEREAIASPLASGTYSGADIRVVVHLPFDQSVAKNQRKVLEQALGDSRTKLQSNDIKTKIEATESISYLEDRLFRLNEMMDTPIPAKVLAELQTISYSIYRGKTPVRHLGSVYARGFVRGPRTIAGSMVFTMFHQHALTDILEFGLSPYNTGHVGRDRDYYQYTTMLIDQLPPLDLTILFANEYGDMSYMSLWGVEFISDGGTFSIEDLFSEGVVQYVARDIDLMRTTISRATDATTNLLLDTDSPVTASQLYWNELGQTAGRVNKRRNPYI